MDRRTFIRKCQMAQSIVCNRRSTSLSTGEGYVDFMVYSGDGEEIEGHFSIYKYNTEEQIHDEYMRLERYVTSI